MRPSMILLTTITCMTTGCATGRLETSRAFRGGLAACETPSYDKAQLRFRCGEATYDLLRQPVRSERVFDIVTREAFTRRYFVVRSGGRQYAYKTVQLSGERYPRKVMLETHQGFRRMLLDPKGDIIVADRALELGQ